MILNSMIIDYSFDFVINSLAGFLNFNFLEFPNLNSSSLAQWKDKNIDQ
jgi:hypothetical protein